MCFGQEDKKFKRPFSPNRNLSRTRRSVNPIKFSSTPAVLSRILAHEGLLNGKFDPTQRIARTQAKAPRQHRYRSALGLGLMPPATDRRAGARGGGCAANLRCVRIRSITEGSSIAVMIFSLPPWPEIHGLQQWQLRSFGTIFKCNRDVLLRPTLNAMVSKFNSLSNFHRADARKRRQLKFNTSEMCDPYLLYDAIPNFNFRVTYFAQPSALRKIMLGC